MAHNIRIVRTGDETLLAEILHETAALHAAAMPDVFRGPAAADDLIRQARGMANDPGGRLAVAELQNGEIAGYCFSVIEKIGENDAVLLPRRCLKIRDIAVVSRCQSRGIGRALVEDAFLWGKALGVAEATLYVWSFNEKAVKFYRSLGFQIDAHLMGVDISNRE